MTQPVDVGAILGGRYKVTGQVLVSADADYVFDGVDQILSRKVSILVPADEHAEDMAHHARQVAVGERSDPLQVLDLGRTQGHRYLVTNRASAAELLDLLLVEDHVDEDEDDEVRPFDVERTGAVRASRSAEQPTQSRPITGYAPEDRDEDDEGLESEIFDDDDDDARHGQEEEQPAVTRGRSRWGLRRFGAGAGAGAGAAAGALASRGRPSDPDIDQHATDAVDTTSFDAIDAIDVRGTGDDDGDDEQPQYGDDGGTWDESGYDDGDHGAIVARGDDDRADLDEDRYDEDDDLDARTAGTAGGFAAEDGDGTEERSTDDDELEEDDRENDPRFSRALVGILVIALILAGVFFAYTQLGKLTGGSPSAEQSPSATASATPTPGMSNASTAPAAPAVPPRISGVTREMKNNQFEGIAALDRLLPRLHDGNSATDWFSSTYSNANFAGLADNLALVFALQQPAKVSRVDITQQGGQGGSFQIMVNDQPTIDGARQVAQGSFTSPEVSVSLPGGTPAAKYVIVNFTELPRINGGQYPYGLRISEVALS